MNLDVSTLQCIGHCTMFVQDSMSTFPWHVPAANVLLYHIVPIPTVRFASRIWAHHEMMQQDMNP
eukprot:3161085-Prorocentrum_lima.AAC.1